MVLMEANRGKPVDVVARSLHIRLAETAEAILASQRLEQREYDSFDEYCDHLLVFDRNKNGPEAVIGSYRLMRREQAARRGQFYSADEYDLSALMAYPGEILELGRSCVDAAFRTGSTMQLLWRGIAEYVFYYNIDIMFGCASLPSVTPAELDLPLSYLYHHHLAPPALRPRALPNRYIEMNKIPVDEINLREAKRLLPPLIRGYLRLGGFVGDGAVLDQDFGTTDVAIVVKTDWVTEKYYRHYRLAGESARE